MVSAVAASIGAFVTQTAFVFAGNSRLFGLLQPGSGWYTNVEMSQRYASLVTPARWAFAIWGIIYTWESAAMAYLVFDPSVASWPSLRLWIAANAFQALWSPLFATERLALSAVALSGIAVSLVGVGISLSPNLPLLSYAVFAAPIWLHAGWTIAASIVNLNLVFGPVRGASVDAQLSAAYLSTFAATAVGLAVVAFVPPPLPLPLVASLVWALAAIRAEIRAPDLIKTSSAYAGIGEVGRAALEQTIGLLAVALATGTVLLSAVRWASVSAV